MRRRAAQDLGIDDELGRECEAFLGGDYLSWLDVAGMPTAGWAYLNRVAHGTYDEVHEHVGLHGLPEQPGSFPDAALMIEAIVLATTAPDELPSVQRDLLVPLELEVMDHVVSPRAAVERVTRALF